MSMLAAFSSYVYFLRYRWSPTITFWRVTAFIDIAWTANQHNIKLFKSYATAGYTLCGWFWVGLSGLNIIIIKVMLGKAFMRLEWNNEN